MRSLVLFPIVVMVSCTFPDVQFGDASVPIDTGTDVVVMNDAGDDAPFDPCDMDHDGYKAEGGTCNGNDCNDNNPNQNPGIQNPSYEVPDAAPFGDWNCDGKVDPVYPFLTCGLTGSCQAGTFTTNTGCGISNPFVMCTGLACAAVDAGTKTQGCL
jgi:hypothetical protein